MKNRPPEWKAYEKQIYESLKGRVAPDAKVTFDENGKQRLFGQKSKTKRQIDVIVCGKFANLPSEHLMVVDCKCIKRKIDVEKVESFIGLVYDVGVEFGLMVTTVGFSKSAKRRAMAERGIMLDVVELDQLKFWLSQRPSVSYTHAAKYGYLHYFDGEKVETRMVEREFAERLAAELNKE